MSGGPPAVPSLASPRIASADPSRTGRCKTWAGERGESDAEFVKTFPAHVQLQRAFCLHLLPTLVPCQRCLPTLRQYHNDPLRFLSPFRRSPFLALSLSLSLSVSLSTHLLGEGHAILV